MRSKAILISIGTLALAASFPSRAAPVIPASVIGRHNDTKMPLFPEMNDHPHFSPNDVFSVVGIYSTEAEKEQGIQFVGNTYLLCPDGSWYNPQTNETGMITQLRMVSPLVTT